MVLPYKTIQVLRGAKVDDNVSVVYDNKTKFIRCVSVLTHQHTGTPVYWHKIRRRITQRELERRAIIRLNALY